MRLRFLRRELDGSNQGFGQSVGLLPVGDKKRKQIAAGGGNESSGRGGSNQEIIRGRHPPTPPPSALKPEVTMISASLDNPALSQPGIRNRGDLGEKISAAANKWLPGGEVQEESSQGPRLSIRIDIWIFPSDTIFVDRETAMLSRGEWSGSPTHSLKSCGESD